MIEFEDALSFLNRLLNDRTGDQLSGVEVEVLKAAWEDYTYEQAAELSKEYAPTYLQNRAAPELWNRLSVLIGRGGKVTKKRFRGMIVREIQNDQATSLNQSSLQKDPFVRGGSPPRIAELCGYEDELLKLREGIESKHCVLLLGPHGVGKSTISAKLVDQVAHESHPKFEAVIWRSLHHAPELDELVNDIIKLMGHPDVDGLELASSPAKISVLLDNLKARRFLLVLDDAEAILQGGRMASYRDHYKDYGSFFRRIIEEQHSSCLLMLSSEPYMDLSVLINSGSSAQLIKLEGLKTDKAKQMLAPMNLKARGKDDWQKLIELYRGNPFMLKVIAGRIQEYFCGNITAFLECQTFFLGDAFKATLGEILAPECLTGIEKQILKYLADRMNQGVYSVGFSTLLTDLPGSTTEIIESVESLASRSLLEKNKGAEGEAWLGLAPVIGQYISKTSLGFSDPQYQAGK